MLLYPETSPVRVKGSGTLPSWDFFTGSDFCVLGCSAMGNHHIWSLSQCPKSMCCTPWVTLSSTGCPVLLVFISQLQLCRAGEEMKNNTKSSSEQVTHPSEGLAWWHSLACAGLWSTGWTNPVDSLVLSLTCSSLQKLDPISWKALV